jgi:hypothetical protein
MDPLIARASKQVRSLLDPVRHLLRQYCDERRPLRLPEKVPKPELRPHAVNPIRPARSGHLRGQVLQTLAVDDQHVAGLGGSASLIEEPSQEQLS